MSVHACTRVRVRVCVHSCVHGRTCMRARMCVCVASPHCMVCSITDLKHLARHAQISEWVADAHTDIWTL